MKIIQSGSIFKIHSDDLVVKDKLPNGMYEVKFNRDNGFFLVAVDELELKEGKVYGSREEKIDKLVKAYESSPRSVGAILSGDKGIGKSLFTVMLANRMNSLGIPTILVKDAYPGITSFLESIKQEVVVLFDEFEKMFNGDGEPQSRMLGMLDGMSNDKRMYLITVNELKRVNEYLLNRPGRFHYHFTFAYPTLEEVAEYMSDKLAPEYHTEIPKVQVFSTMTDLNYDCLRAIASEINLGYNFEDAIGDLNIEAQGKQYDGRVILDNGMELTTVSPMELNLTDVKGAYSDRYLEFKPTINQLYDMLDMKYLASRVARTLRSNHAYGLAVGNEELLSALNEYVDSDRLLELLETDHLSEVAYSDMEVCKNAVQLFKELQSGDTTTLERLVSYTTAGVVVDLYPQDATVLNGKIVFDIDKLENSPGEVNLNLESVSLKNESQRYGLPNSIKLDEFKVTPKKLILTPARALGKKK